MKKKSKNYIKNIGLFSIGSLGAKIITFLMVPLYTQYLSTSTYGNIDLMTTIVEFVTPILTLTIYDATLRFSMDNKYNISDVFSSSMRVINIGTIILMALLLGIYYFNILDIDEKYYVFIFCLFLFSALNYNLTMYIKAKNKVSIIAGANILGTTIICSFSILTICFWGMEIDGYMISYIAGLAVQVIFVFIKGKAYMDYHMIAFNNLSSKMIMYSTPLIANAVAWWVNNSSDRILITAFLGSAMTGIYAVANKIPTILATFQGIVCNAWTISAISEYDKDDKDGFIGRNYELFSLISMGGAICIILVNKLVTKILFAEEYYDAWKCIPFLLVGMVFCGIAQFEGSIFSAIKKTKIIAFTTVVGAVINTILNLFFIKVWGISGAAFSTMIGYFIVWIIRTIELNVVMHMKVSWIKHILSLVCTVCLAMFATFGICIIFQIIIFIGILIINRAMFHSFLLKITK